MVRTATNTVILRQGEQSKVCIYVAHEHFSGISWTDMSVLSLILKTLEKLNHNVVPKYVI